MSDSILNPSEQKTALSIARQTLAAYFDNRDYVPETNSMKIFSEPRGVFVTLWKNGNLRGCIGVLEPKKPLAENIKNMALAAALEDKRFTPLIKDELNKIKIEISVLSPLRKIASIGEITLGAHGVYLERGKKNGIFLPQVAGLAGWDKETFLNTLCVEKAGLESGCYLDPKTKLFIFTTQMFEE